MVGAWRFELQTSCAQGRRATRLRYAPIRLHSEHSMQTSKLIKRVFSIHRQIRFLSF